MGDGVTGPVNAPVQTTNARHSALTDPAARLKFDNALEQQCPEGLGRPSRYDPPCTYLRNPSQPPEPSKPDVDLKLHEDPNKGPTDGSKVLDTKPIPQKPSDSPKVPENPKHSTGQSEGDKAHIFKWEWKI